MVRRRPYWIYQLKQNCGSNDSVILAIYDQETLSFQKSADANFSPNLPRGLQHLQNLD